MVPHARVRIQDEVLTCSSRSYEAPSDLRFTIYDLGLEPHHIGCYELRKHSHLLDQSFDVDAFCFAAGVADEDGVAVGIDY